MHDIICCILLVHLTILKEGGESKFYLDTFYKN